MIAVKFYFSFLSLGLFYVSNPAFSFSAFENDKSCITIEKTTKTRTIIVQKKSSLAIVVRWEFKKGKWLSKTGDLYEKKIYANDGKGLEFCFVNTSREDTGPYIWKDVHDTNIITFNVWYGPTNMITSPNLSEFQVIEKTPQIMINCTAECKPHCNIIWRKDKDPYITNSTASSSLVLKNVSKKDSGDYTCWAENPKNNNHLLSTKISIIVKYAAKINSTFLTEMVVKENSNTNITCNVDSYPLSNISWFRENLEINTTHIVENEVVLHFENTSCDNTGIYQCTAFNGIGQIVTKESLLNVTCKPRFVNNYFGNSIVEKATSFIGDKIEMNISIQANPTPHVVYSDFGIYTEIFGTSNTIYKVAVKKIVLSEYDFRQHTLIFGNSQGNVTIVFDIEKKRRNSGIFYGYVIGTTMIVLILISILVLLLTVIKRRKHNKDIQTNSNTANNDDTGGYRDNILYQSVDSVPLEARDNNFDFSDSDSFKSQVSLSIPNVNECPKEDEESKKETTKIRAGRLNTKQVINNDLNITINNTNDKNKRRRKPMPRPRRTKPYTGNFNKVQQPRMQEDFNFGKIALAEKQLPCKAIRSEKNRTPSLNSIDGSKFPLSNERQLGPSHDNFENPVSYKFAVLSAQRFLERNKVDVSLMDPNTGSESSAKFPGLISNYLQTYIEQDTQEYKPQMHTVKPLNVDIEVACKSKTILQHGDEYTESEQVAHYENVSYDGYKTKDKDNLCQFHDYMNI